MQVFAFIDESGQRAFSEKASDCFIMAAIYYRDALEGQVHALLAKLRKDLGRRPGDSLKWENLKTHPKRLHAVKCMAAAEFLDITAVVVCKRAIPPEKRLVDEDKAYLYTYRLLLERLSWMAAARQCQLRHTLAHIVRFKAEKLRQYETRLVEASTSINWAWLKNPTRIGHPEQQECLQLADLAASAIGAAFNLDPYGSTEPRYLRELLPALKRHREQKVLTSYGLKMHPWTEVVREVYPWVLKL